MDCARTIENAFEKVPGQEKDFSKKKGKKSIFSVKPPALLPFCCMLVFCDGPLFPCAFLAALLHEAGHIAAIYFFGGRVSKFVLHPFGAEIVTGGKILSYSQSLVVALSGAMINLLCALLLLLRTCPYFLQVFSAVSLGLALFNLLPFSSLDGGEALFVFCSVFFSMDVAQKICRFFSFAGMLVLFAFMLFSILFFHFNPLFLLLFVYLLWGAL